MINQQLVEYIRQQLQAGVQRDTVRKALTDAGWGAADIDDSMKAAEPAAVSAAASPFAGSAASPASIDPVVAMGGLDAATSRIEADKSVATDKFFSKTSALQGKPVVVDEDDDDHPSARKFMGALIAMGVVILLLAGALAFVYFNMSGQLSAAQQAGGGNSTQASALQSQVAQLAKDKSDLASQVQSLTGENQALVGELGFFAVSGSSTSTAPVSATIKGTLTGTASTTFTLMTLHNVRILVANSKDAKVSAALTPLANGAASVTLGGTHPPATPNLTVTSVNGAAL